LALTELRLLLRKKITAFSVVVVPIFVCASAWLQFRSLPAADWPPGLAIMSAMLLLLSVFLVSTTVFTARRQSLVLQRLRTSELTDNGVFAGIAAPIAVVGLAQTVLFLGFCLVIGAPAPSGVPVVLLGLVTGVLGALLGGVATAAFSRSVEVTQITAMPFLLVAFAGIFLARFDTPVGVIGSLLPLAGPAELIAQGWTGSIPLAALASSLLWPVLLGLVSMKFFKWEPRQ
jgi:ABC-2 type transport system permease protein